MSKYIIAHNPDMTQWSCTSLENWEKYDYMRVDVDDQPMTLVETFQAASQEAAKAHMENVAGRMMGWDQEKEPE